MAYGNEDIGRIAETLHPLERKILPILKKGTFSEIAAKAGLRESEISRPLQWLQEKGLAKIHESSAQVAVLSENGIAYLGKGLPEKRLSDFLAVPRTMDEVRQGSGLSQDEISVSIGILRKRNFLAFREGRMHVEKKPDFPEQEFLALLPKEASSLNPGENEILSSLLKRKGILELQENKLFSAEITDLGHEVRKVKLQNIVDNITPELLAGDSSWMKDARYRRYDVTVPPKKTFAGRRHFVREAIEYIRSIWLEMGFREMTGSIVQTSFWNFDALFTAQYHPVREMQDTFFLREPKYGSLPEKEMVQNVKAMHEHGGKIGSRGWQYKWSEEEARKNVLRTHTTPLSAQAISRLKHADLPAKFFSVGQAFRNETMDWSHLFELTQSEGIVIDEDANLRNLLGYLKEFFLKMGYSKIRARPGYFPYTEPSVEIDVFHPVHKKWVELGGSGIFRPEVTVALLGKDVPVLAWGLGPGRIMMGYYGLSDIRSLHKNDLKELREIKAWLL